MPIHKRGRVEGDVGKPLLLQATFVCRNLVSNVLSLVMQKKRDKALSRMSALASELIYKDTEFMH